MNKIFGIGLSHTGTNSLNQALNMLGFKSIHWPVDRLTFKELSQGNYNLSILRTYQAITDIQVSPYFKQLDRAYPGSKFILTTRDKDSWMRSMRNINGEWLRYTGGHPLANYTRRLLDDLRDYKLGAFRSLWFRITHDEAIEFYRVAMYGGKAFQDERRISDVYDEHIERVKSYFSGRESDLLIMNIQAGDGWNRLCPFLGTSLPGAEFPHIFDTRRRKKYASSSPTDIK